LASSEMKSSAPSKRFNRARKESDRISASDAASLMSLAPLFHPQSQH
jgi:hypothetical protein